MNVNENKQIKGRVKEFVSSELCSSMKRECKACYDNGYDVLFTSCVFSMLSGVIRTLSNENERHCYVSKFLESTTGDDKTIFLPLTKAMTIRNRFAHGCLGSFEEVDVESIRTAYNRFMEKLVKKYECNELRQCELAD